MGTNHSRWKMGNGVNWELRLKMNPTTEKILLDELHNHDYSAFGEVYDVQRLFDIYSAREINTMSDLRDGYRSFINFIRNHVTMFKYPEKGEDYRSILLQANQCVRELNVLHMFASHRREIEDYVGVVKEVVPEKSDGVLDVGAGTAPYSSILLGGDGYDVTAMDMLTLSAECLSHFGVKSHRELFTSKTPINDYDIVVGRRPCSAIPHIVNNCVSHNVPYIMKLCKCESPNGRMSGWRKYLSELDDHIGYFGDYAYNLRLGDGRYYTSDTDEKIFAHDKFYETDPDEPFYAPFDDE